MVGSGKCTVRDLFVSMQQITTDDRAVVAAATYLINSGRVRLGGKLNGAKVQLSPSLHAFPKFLWPSLLGQLQSLPVRR